MDPDIDDATVARFMSATGCNLQHAHFLLEATNGNFENAQQMYYDTLAAAGPAPPPAPVAPRPGPLQTPPRPMAPAARQQAQQQAQYGIVGAVSRLPFRLLWAGLGVVGSVLRVGFAAAAFVGDRVLPPSLMAVVRDVAAAVSPTAAGAETSPAEQARSFAAAFAARYGSPHPAFLEQGWRDATTAAHRQFKFLLVYLHAPEHEATDQFCRDTLCSPAFVAATQQQFVCWGGDIRHPDAFSLAVRLQVSSYPTVALLAYSGTRTKLAATVQGSLVPGQLLAILNRAVEEQGAMLVAERAELEERERSRQLLAEQNAEYEAALAADREREAQREQARLAAEAEQRQREAEEAAARAEVEAAEARRLEAIANVQRRRREAAASLPVEPGDKEASATIRVRLPDGSNHQRRFSAANSVQQLYTWVDSLEGCDYPKYSLVCNFPRRVYGGDSCRLSLEEAGLVPQGVLFVQQEDHEELEQ